MRRQLLVELSRFRSRRAIALIGLAAVVVAMTLALVTAYQTRPLTDADRADATARADLASRDSVLQSDLADCIADPEAYLGPDATARECRDALVRDVASFYPRTALDLGKVLDASRLTQATGFSLALIVAGLMILAGSTFAGADWSSGSVTNQLLFEPRRGRVWLAKAAAVVIGSGLVALVAIGGFWTAMWALSEARGISVTTAVGTRIGWHVVRAVALAMAAALGGYALTMVFRHTVATLGLVFVYGVGGELAVALLPFDGIGRFSVATNVFGWLATRASYFDPSIECEQGSSCSSLQVMSHLESGLFLGVLLLIAVGVSYAWFRRAEV